MKKLFAILFISLSIISCSEKTETSASAETNKTSSNDLVDVGKLELVEVRSNGSGKTVGAAVNEALLIAINQVNGSVVNSASLNLNIAAVTDTKINISDDSIKIKETLSSNAFADLISNESQGVISSFKLEDVSHKNTDGGIYTVEVVAKISKFMNPKSDGKLKIVVMPLKSSMPNINIGGKTISSNLILEPIRQQIIDSLVQSGRFSVLDRQFSDDIKAELEMIESGDTSREDLAKLSKAMSADVIWVGALNEFSYDKSVQHLRASGRDLISYSGSWSITQRLLNLTTRQVILSETFKGKLPGIELSSSSRNISNNSVISDFQTEIVRKTTESIISKSFPIKIVNIEGDDVVINQGSGIVAEGNIYKIVQLGKAVKDPQTGQSLGHIESDCCEVQINRVTPKLSYGKLQNLKIKLSDIKGNSLQLSEIIHNDKKDGTIVEPTRNASTKVQSKVLDENFGIDTVETKKNDANW